MIRITFHDSHSYPGCLVSATGLGAGGTTERVTAHFEDGSQAEAECEFLSPGEFVIHIDPYVTSKGTSIQAKSWVVDRLANANGWKVARRL